jgi:predicted alpha/beta hydrolase
MQRIVSQVVFKPNPGADMMKLMALVKESVAIWRSHGADVSLWRYRLEKWAIWFLQPALRVSQPMVHAWKKYMPIQLLQPGTPKALHRV